MKSIIIFAVIFYIGYVRGQQCQPTQEQINELAMDVNTVVAALEPIIRADPAINETTQGILISQVCTSDQVRPYVDGIAQKLGFCPALILDRSTGLHQLTFGEYTFIGLFQEYRNVSHFCDCYLVQVGRLITAMNTMAMAVEPFVIVNDFRGAIDELCSPTGSKPDLETISDIAKDCKVGRDILKANEEDLTLATYKITDILLYPDVDAFCELATSQQLCQPSQQQIEALASDVNAIVTAMTPIVAADPAINETTQGQIIFQVCNSDQVRQHVNGIAQKIAACPTLLVVTGTGLDQLSFGVFTFYSLFEDYSNVDAFCDCLLVKYPEFEQAIQIIATNLEPYVSSNDTAGFLAEICSTTGSKPSVETIYTIAKQCSTIRDQLEMFEDAFTFGAYKLLDILQFSSVSQFCTCSSSIQCVSMVDYSQLITRKELSPWKTLPNFQYVCSDNVVCAAVGAEECKEQLQAIIPAFSDSNADRLMALRAFQTKHCSQIKAYADFATEGGMCMLQRADSLLLRNCFGRVEADKTTSKSCYFRECVKGNLRECSETWAVQVYIDAVNLYTTNPIQESDDKCGAAATSVSGFLQLAVLALSFMCNNI